MASPAVRAHDVKSGYNTDTTLGIVWTDDADTRRVDKLLIEPNADLFPRWGTPEYKALLPAVLYLHVLKKGAPDASSVAGSLVQLGTAQQYVDLTLFMPVLLAEKRDGKVIVQL